MGVIENFKGPVHRTWSFDYIPKHIYREPSRCEKWKPFNNDIGCSCSTVDQSFDRSTRNSFFISPLQRTRQTYRVYQREQRFSDIFPENKEYPQRANFDFGLPRESCVLEMTVHRGEKNVEERHRCSYICDDKSIFRSDIRNGNRRKRNEKEKKNRYFRTND